MRSLRSTLKYRDEDGVLKTLSQELPVGVCIMQDGKFCYVNPAFPIAIGYTMDELIGKDSFEIVFPEDREIVKDKTIKMLKGELLSPYQFRVACKDGRIVWVMATVKSIAYRGRPAILGNYMEITERTQMEEAIKESEKRYRELTDSITDVFFAMDENLRYTYWNKASEILTGIRAEDAIGKSLREVFPDAPWRTKAEQMYREVLRTGQRHAFVNDYYTDGSRYILEVNAYPSRAGVSVFVKDITEQRQTEDARREAEEERSALLEEAPVAIVHTDLKGEITYVNQRFESESGYSRGEIIGKSGLQLGWFPADTLELLGKRISARLAGSPPKHWETEFRCKNGQWIWIELEGKILARSGAPVGFQIIATNITERKQAEQALRCSEERYRTILEEMEEGYYEVDLAGSFTFVNDAMCRMLGYSRDALTGMNYKTFTPKEDIKAIFEAYNTVYRTGEPLRWFPMVEVKRDGTRVLVEDSVLPVRNDEGQIVGFRGVSRDVTERKLAEEALELQRAYFQQLFNNSPDAIVILDTETKLVEANKAFEKLFGYSCAEIKGRTIKELIIPEDRLEEASAVFRMVLQGRVVRKELVRRCKDGGLLDVSMVAYPVRFDSKLVGIYSIYSDITERKRAEEALRQSEEKYRTILEEMEDAYFEVDLGGHFTFANNSVSRDLGYSKEELIAMSYKKFTVEEDIESVSRLFNEVYRTGVPNKGFSWRTIRKDGLQGFVEASVSPSRNNKGETIGFRGVGRDVTERKRMEDALRESERRLRLISENSRDIICLHDADHTYIYVSPACKEILGYGSDELVGTDPWKLVHPEDLESLRREGQEKALRGLPVLLSYRVRKTTGEYIWFESASQLLKDDAGSVLGFVTSSRDITERKKAENALQQSEEKYRALFDSTVVGTIVIDAETLQVMMANQAAAKIFGFHSPDESIGANVLDFLYPGDDETARDPVVKELFEQELGHVHELRALTKDGGEIWVSVQAAKITHDGRLAGLLSFTDITRHKRMEEDLKLAAAQWKKTFDSIIDGVSIHDRDFRILQVNKAFTELFQTRPDQIIGKHCYELHKAERPHRDCPHQQTLATGNPAAADFYEPHLRKFLRESTAPILNEKGEVVASVHLTRDVTEQKLQNERLMMTDRLASLGELASGAAHELNNPLTSIIGFSQLLMEKELPEDIREDLKLINSEAQRAASVTKNLLTFARKQAPVREPNQMNNIIEDVLRLRAYEHKANGIEVERHLAPDLSEVMVDYFQMQQVFMNIIINAEYFMTDAHNGGTLTITSKKHNDTVTILFTDDGPGIPPDNLTRIFDPFFTTKEAGKGTGLGLSICHGIVTEHGGQIYARSQLGKGATIVVELPVSRKRSSRKQA